MLMHLLFVIMEHDERRLGLSNAHVDMEYGNNRTRDIAIAHRILIL